MQEEQTVSFQPMTSCGPQPWFTNLLELYLLCVLVLLLVQSVQIRLILRKLRKLQKQPESHSLSADVLRRTGQRRALSLKSFVTLTFFLSLLHFTWSSSDVLLGVRTQKITNATFVLARIGDDLIPFSFGLIVCIALYIAAMLAESALRRRQIETD